MPTATKRKPAKDPMPGSSATASDEAPSPPVPIAPKPAPATRTTKIPSMQSVPAAQQVAARDGTLGVNKLVTHVDMEHEYVAAGGFGFVGTFARTLAPYIDDIDRDFPGTYNQMRHDPMPESSVRTFITALLQNGLHVHPGADKDDTNYAHAQRISDMVENDIANLDTPVLQCFQEMAQAIFKGYRLAEIIWERRLDPFDNLVYNHLRDLRCKPNQALAFIVNAQNQTLGYVYLKPGQPIPSIAELSPLLIPGPFGGDQDNPTPFLDPDKIFPFAPFAENGDMRGKSMFRSAYHPWWVKQQVWAAYMQYLSTFAQPSLIGYTDPDAELEDDPSDATGSTSPEDRMLAKLIMVHNGSCAAFPGKAKVDILYAHGDGGVFQTALQICNDEIVTAILGQTLMTGDSKHMARAASEVHQDVFGTLVRHVKQLLIGAFDRYVILPLVRSNFGDDAARELRPVIALGETEHQDFAQYATAIANLWSVGFFDQESQAEGLDTLLQVPPRDPQGWRDRLAAVQALLLSTNIDPATGAPAAPGAPGGSAGGAGKGTMLAQAVSKSNDRQIARSEAKKVAGRVTLE